MKKSDIELQELAQKGKLEIIGLDSKVYVQVFRALSQKPSFKLSVHFADRLISRIIEAQTRRSARRDFLYLTGGLFSLVLAAIIVILITGFRPGSGAFAFIHRYNGLIIFGAVFIIFLQWVDKKILHGKSQHEKSIS